MIHAGSNPAHVTIGVGSSTANACAPTFGYDGLFTQPGGLLQGGRSVRVRDVSYSMPRTCWKQTEGEVGVGGEYRS